MAKDDGGPAFPAEIMEQTSGGGNGWTTYSPAKVPGMSLRDYFAGQAMQGILAYEGLIGAGEPSSVAACAYELADAMLAEREK